MRCVRGRTLFISKVPKNQPDGLGSSVTVPRDTDDLRLTGWKEIGFEESKDEICR